MKFIKYSKYVPDPFEDMSSEELMQMLQDFLLESGYQRSHLGFQEMDTNSTLD